MRHTFRETWSGLKRNMSMTIAVIVTMTVSLTLFGLSVMTFQEVDRVKGRWYDKIEISRLLVHENSAARVNPVTVNRGRTPPTSSGRTSAPDWSRTLTSKRFSTNPSRMRTTITSAPMQILRCSIR